MKATRTILASILLFVCSIIVNAQPMSYNAMRDNARFLTDRMAYTLGVTSAIVIDDLYRINYDYICGVNNYLDDVALGYRYNDYMAVMYERDRALQSLLGANIWARLITFDYFYRPIVFADRRWSFGIYAHDSHRNRFYCRAPRPFNDYRGGHFFAGMRPANHPPYRISSAPNRPTFHIGNRDNRQPSNMSISRPGNRTPERVEPVRVDKKNEVNRSKQPVRNGGNRSSGNMRSSSRSTSGNVSGVRISSAKAKGDADSSKNGGAGRGTGGRR